MRKIWALAVKEWSDYFHSPLAYIILTASLAIFNAFFFLIIDQNREAVLRDVFQVMEFLFVFIVPLWTMRSVAEETSRGTAEFLMTAPIKAEQIIIGKYLGHLMFVSVLIGLTGVYYLILAAFAHPDAAPIMTGYIGIWLEAALFIAAGIFCSALTSSQVVAAILSYVLLFFLYFSVTLQKFLTGIPLVVLQYLGTAGHLGHFTAGMVQLSDIVYYLSGTVLFIYLAVCVFDKR